MWVRGFLLRVQSPLESVSNMESHHSSVFDNANDLIDCAALTLKRDIINGMV
jgi:hypothetical protein